ncbi:MAG: HEAT repeat domain-containing protein [Polyangiales bacterium]
MTSVTGCLLPRLGEGRRVSVRRVRSSRALPPPLPLPIDHYGSDAAPALIAQLTSSTSWETRTSAALSLAQLRADGVVPALVHALRDRSVEVAVAAAEALAIQGGDDAQTELLAVLENNDGYFSPVTRVAAISGLARRLDTTQLGPVFAALRDIDAEVSIAAVAVIADRVPAQASGLLLPLLRDRTGYYLSIVRLAVANALERTGGLHAGVVGELLAHEQDASVRRVLERAAYLAEPTLSGQ